jgi:ATP-dependent RNA helicase DOB1
MGVHDDAHAEGVARLSALETSIASHALHTAPARDTLLAECRRRDDVRQRIAALTRRIDDVAAVVHMDELHARKRLLAAMGYTAGGAGDVVSMKGRVACEISTGEEVLLTEMMFAGAFNDLAPEVVAALLSCVVFQERVGSSTGRGSAGDAADGAQDGGDAPAGEAAAGAPVDGSSAALSLRAELAAPLKVLQETARQVARASVECGVPLEGGNEEGYVQQLRPELMEVVYQWCRGARFARICRMTEVFEGSIIRCMRRLEELLRQMAAAAHSIGNAVLETKFNDAIARLKRDIVFANSLYL